MKKYTLFLFALAFVFGLFSVINASSVSAANCASGDLFNTATGQRCVSWTDNSSNDLKIGSRGESVKTFQQILKDAGFLSGKVDGIYGRITDGAARNYYKKYPCYLGASINSIINRVCPPVSVNAPVISGVSGPQTLNVNQTGTWTVTAYDPKSDLLSYTVVWGDEVYYASGSTSVMQRPAQQSATFTHSYSQAGIYTPTFTVTNQSGQSAKSSLSVNVGNVINTNNLSINPTSATIKVGETTTFQALFNNCPVGAECFVGPLPVQATWTSSNTSVATVAYKNTCPKSMYCIALAPDYLTAVVSGISEGTATITATYKTSGGNTLTATALVTVKNSSTTLSPTISYLSPNSGAIGTSVVIYGSGFGNACTPTAPDYCRSALLANNTIKFGSGKIAHVTYANDGTNLSFMVPSELSGGGECSTFNGITSCTPAYVVPVTAGNYAVSVTNANGTSNAVNFTVTSPTANQVPNIISILPAGCNSNMGYSITTGEPCSISRTQANFGETVHVYGSNFDSSNYLYTYSSLTGDYIAIPINIISSSLFSFVVPSNAGASPHGITLRDYDNSSFTGTTASLTFVATTTQPSSITYLSPSSGVVGTQVTLYGTGFTSTGNKIKFGNLGVENSPTYNLNSNGTSITFTVPTSNYYACWDTIPACKIAAQMVAPGVYPVSVINANGTSNAVNFTVTSGNQTSSPTISSLSPSSGVVGTQVTVYGNSLSGATVKFGGYPVTTTYNSDALLIFTVPSNLNNCSSIIDMACTQLYLPVNPGEYKVYVTNNGKDSNALTFTVTS